MINISMINLKFLYVNISTVSYNVDNIIPMSYMDLFQRDQESSTGHGYAKKYVYSRLYAVDCKVEQFIKNTHQKLRLAKHSQSGATKLLTCYVLCHYAISLQACGLLLCHQWQHLHGKFYQSFHLEKRARNYENRTVL